jgi:alcohol dehydrogenase class IV
MPSSIDEGARWVADLVHELGVPKRSRYGLDEQDVADPVADAKRASSMRYNPLDLSDQALASCLRNAL